MNLFKRLLLNLFPRSFGGNQGPAGVFLSLVNAKHFFTVMSKRMVENPKLNFFDIGEDALETKIGFGPEAMIKPKDIEGYYSYCAAANLNGYKSYSIMNITTLLVISYSQFLIKYFPKTKKGIDMIMIILLTIHITPYFYVTKIKNFEELGDIQRQFNHFITLFCELIKRVAHWQSIKLSKKQIIEIKNIIVSEHKLFFGLFYICKDITTLIHEDRTAQDIAIWMLQNNENNKQKLGELQEHTFDISDAEWNYILGVIPVEFITKMLYGRSDVFIISEHIIPNIFHAEKLLTLISDFITDRGLGKRNSEFYTYLLDHMLRKKNFFPSVKKMIESRYQSINGSKDSDIEEFLSTISDGSGSIIIPESMRKEGILMDRLLNFYVGLMGVFFIGKADTSYHRLFHGPLLSVISGGFELATQSDYIKNIEIRQHKCDYFHHIIFQGVSSGKASFIVPYVARETTQVSNSVFLCQQFVRNALSVISQDILPKDIKLTIHNEAIVKAFQNSYADKISQYMELNNLSFMEVFYKNTDIFLGGGTVGSILGLTTSNDEYKNNKESCYTLEYRLYDQFVSLLSKHGVCSHLSIIERIVFLGQLRDTMIGCCVFYAAFIDKIIKHNLKLDSKKFMYVYCRSVLGLSDKDSALCLPLLLDIYYTHESLCRMIYQMDDNKYFLEVGIDCRSLFENKNDSYGIIKEISKEDELWLIGYLRHITYYNKRYIFPKI